MTDGLLVAANTGAPLDAAGVESLSNLRASAKAPDGSAAGRFGVGFAAVRAVCDAPAVVSTSGGVRWSLSETRELVERLPVLAAELSRRGDALPVLRMPFPSAEVPPAGFDTAVLLPLRNEAAVTAVHRELAEVDPVLLLALSGLAEVEVDGRRMTSRRSGPDVVLDDDGEQTRWRVVRRSGSLPSALVADRTVEERATWQVLCAVPLGDSSEESPARPVPVPLPSSVPMVVRAPTLTDEPLSLPAVVVGSWPLDSTRRWIAAGPLCSALVEHTATAYAELVRQLATRPEVLDLIPVGLAAGSLDDELRSAVLANLAETPFLPSADEPTPNLRPRDALAVDLGPTAPRLLADVLPGVVPAPWAARLAPLAVLGVRRLSTADVVDALAGLDRSPAWWGRLYAVLAESHLGGPEREALGALPVPLADGRVVRGPRDLLLPADEVDARAASTVGLRVVHPAAAHQLLGVLGARTATPRGVLADPRLQSAVADSFDAEDPLPLAEAVLLLVTAAGVTPGEMPWLSDLALPATDGGVYPAGELLLPGGELAEVMAHDAPFGTPDPALLQRWGSDVLSAVGVLDSFAVVAAEDVPIDPLDADHDLDGEADWLADVLAGLPASGVTLDSAPPVLAELVAVRDLEFVRPDRWERALALVPIHTLTDPALVLLPDGGRVTAVPYTRWWLARAPVLDGRRPLDLALPGSELLGLYDEAPASLASRAPGMLRALGVRGDVESVVAEPGGAVDLLQRLGSDRPVEREVLRRLHARLSTVAVDPPSRVRAVRDGRARAVDPADAVVVDAPDLLPLVAPLAVVPAPLALAGAVADTLDVPLASELAAFPVVSHGVPARVTSAAYLAHAGRGATVGYHEHTPLLVAAADGRATPVPWRVVDGVAHVDSRVGVAALARALAWRDGRWVDRWYRSALLGEPEAALGLAAERDLD